MGAYTQLSFKLVFKSEDDVEKLMPILEVLTHTKTRAEFEKDGVVPDHPLFSCPRWNHLGSNSAVYFPRRISALTLDENNKYVLYIGGSFKHYDREIPLFMDWIKEYVEDGFIGFFQHENDRYFEYNGENERFRHIFIENGEVRMAISDYSWAEGFDDIEPTLEVLISPILYN